MNGLQYSVLVLIGFTLGVPGAAFSQAAPKPLSTSLGMVVFPAKGQTTQQQSQDEGECYAWAKGQTGVDPMVPPPATAQTAQQPASTTTSKADGSRVRGAARGAAAGAVIGEVADDDAGKGAAIGATPATATDRPFQEGLRCLSRAEGLHGQVTTRPDIECVAHGLEGTCPGGGEKQHGCQEKRCPCK